MTCKCPAIGQGIMNWSIPYKLVNLGIFEILRFVYDIFKILERFWGDLGSGMVSIGFGLKFCTKLKENSVIRLKLKPF